MENELIPQGKQQVREERGTLILSDLINKNDATTKSSEKGALGDGKRFERAEQHGKNEGAVSPQGYMVDPWDFSAWALLNAATSQCRSVS